MVLPHQIRRRINSAFRLEHFLGADRSDHTAFVDCRDAHEDVSLTSKVPRRTRDPHAILGRFARPQSKTPRASNAGKMVVTKTDHELQDKLQKESDAFRSAGQYAQLAMLFDRLAEIQVQLHEIQKKLQPKPPSHLI